MGLDIQFTLVMYIMILQTNYNKIGKILLSILSILFVTWFLRRTIFGYFGNPSEDLHGVILYFNSFFGWVVLVILFIISFGIRERKNRMALFMFCFLYLSICIYIERGYGIWWELYKAGTSLATFDYYLTKYISPVLVLVLVGFNTVLWFTKKPIHDQITK